MQTLYNGRGRGLYIGNLNLYTLKVWTKSISQNSTCCSILWNFYTKFSTFNIWTSPIFKTATTFFENSKFSSYSFAMFKCITFHSSLQFSTIILQNFYSFSEISDYCVSNFVINSRYYEF